MSDAVIVAAVRSAIGKKKGALANTRADDLLALMLKALAERAKVDPAQIEDVIAGCVTQIGEQGFNIARTAALMAGFPIETTGTTVNRQCGSSQQAFHFAAQAVMSGALDVVAACGVESMTRIPMGSDAAMGVPGVAPAIPFSPHVQREVQLRAAAPVGRDDRRQVGHLAQGLRGVRRSRATSAPPRRARAAASATRSSPLKVKGADGAETTFDRGRGHPPRHDAGEARRAQVRRQAGRRGHGRHGVADLRRRRGAPGDDAGEGQAAGPEAARAHQDDDASPASTRR